MEAGDIKKIKVDDIKVAYKRFGEGEPLVMVMGLSGTLDLWEPRVLEALSSAYEVIIFDYRGMGETSTGSKEFSIEQFADDTVGLMDALDIDRAHLLGWSMGGDVVLQLAVAYPGKVDKVVVYAGDCGGKERVITPEVLEEVKKLADPDTPPWEFFNILFPAKWMEENPDFIKTFPIPQEQSSYDNIKRQGDAYLDWEGCFDGLKDIARPTLVITGTEDISTPYENAPILANAIPGSWLVRFEGAGHGLMYQYPEEFSRIVIDFLELSRAKA